MNFDSFQASELSFLRYPPWVDGLDLWRRTVVAPPSEFTPPVGLPTRHLTRPRLFVSYKSQDRHFALRLAYLAHLEGFEYWLDILDPALATGSGSQPSSAKQRSILIATTIELALLNTSHLIAAVTANTSASKWVPYEYGRVKGRTVIAKDAASWIHVSAVQSLPEYLYLCPIHVTEPQIRSWLASERAAWEQAHRTTVSKPAGHWNLPSIPQPLP